MYRLVFDFCVFYIGLILEDVLGFAFIRVYLVYFMGFVFGFWGCFCLSFFEEDKLYGLNGFFLFV